MPAGNDDDDDATSFLELGSAMQPAGGMPWNVPTNATVDEAAATPAPSTTVATTTTTPQEATPDHAAASDADALSGSTAAGDAVSESAVFESVSESYLSGQSISVKISAYIRLELGFTMEFGVPTTPCGVEMDFTGDMNEAMPSFGYTVWIMRPTDITGTENVQQSALYPPDDEQNTYSLARPHELEVDVDSGTPSARQLRIAEEFERTLREAHAKIAAEKARAEAEVAAESQPISPVVRELLVKAREAQHSREYTSY
jgi:hypothetical protein